MGAAEGRAAPRRAVRCRHGKMCPRVSHPTVLLVTPVTPERTVLRRSARGEGEEGSPSTRFRWPPPRVTLVTTVTLQINFYALGYSQGEEGPLLLLTAPLRTEGVYERHSITSSQPGCRTSPAAGRGASTFATTAISTRADTESDMVEAPSRRALVRLCMTLVTFVVTAAYSQ
jgi:hypothetical protein